MPLIETVGSSAARAFGLNSFKPDLELIGYWDPGLSQSAPTGGNGSNWIDISNSAGLSMGNISLGGTTFSYAGSGTSAYVQNSTQSDTGGMPVALNSWNASGSKLYGAMSIWAYPTSYAASNGMFVNRITQDPNDDNWFWIGTWDSGNDFYFRTGIPSSCCGSDLAKGNNTFPGGSGEAPTVFAPTNTWKHWLWMWDLRETVPLSNQYKRLYINGSLKYSRVGFSAQSSSTNPGGVTTGKFGLGHSGGSNSQWLGRFGPIRMFKGNLTASQITDEFNLFRSRYGV
jgi:hypothetical protein